MKSLMLYGFAHDCCSCSIGGLDRAILDAINVKRFALAVTLLSRDYTILCELNIFCFYFDFSLPG